LADEPSSSVLNVGWEGERVASQPSATCQSRLFGKMTANILSISPALHLVVFFIQENFEVIVSKPEQIRYYFLEWTVSLATREAVDQLVIKF
jgi:hypothetical protein